MAQTNGTDPQVVCVGYIGAYQVDYTENSGAGTIGSTYSWSVITAGFSGFISLNQGPGLSENRVIIDWGQRLQGFIKFKLSKQMPGVMDNPLY